MVSSQLNDIIGNLRSLFCVFSDKERKANMTANLAPIQEKYASQLIILEKFATDLVAFLIPATSLTGLFQLAIVHQQDGILIGNICAGYIL